jgi:hypothetical protein
LIDTVKVQHLLQSLLFFIPNDRGQKANLRDNNLLSLGRDGNHLLGLWLSRRLGLQYNDGLGVGALLLGHQDRLRLSLHEGCLRLGQHVILAWHRAGYDVVGLPTGALLDLQHLGLHLMGLARGLHRRDRDELVVGLDALLDDDLTGRGHEEALLLELLLRYGYLVCLGMVLQGLRLLSLCLGPLCLDLSLDLDLLLQLRPLLLGNAYLIRRYLIPRCG